MMPNSNPSPYFAARPGAGFLVRWLMLAALLFGTIVSGMAAEPEKISDSASQQIRALQAEKLGRSTIHRKLDSQFVFQLKQNRGQVIAQGVTKLQPSLKLQADGRVLVDIDANVTEGLLAQIKQSGGTVINNFPQFRAIRALVTLDQLESLAGSADVKFIRRAREAHTHTGSVTSEGDVTHRANIARNTFGVTGQNVKVGVLSDSVNYLAYAQSTGDLGDVTVLPGQGGSGSGEGTAMLEIVHDVAPGAQLYFATAFNGEASFAQNILNLRSNGCDIIVDDVFYFAESPFQDGIIAQAVNTVTAGGALYFSSAGNEGNLKDHTSGTWEGDFVDGGPATPPVNIGGGAIHSFGSATFNTVISPGYGVDLFWADPLGASGNDYDLFVLDSTGAFVVASSLNLQDGTQDPYESVYTVNVGNRIVIVKAAGDARFLHLDTTRGKLSISTAGATKGHSAAAAAFSVAAVDAANAYPNPFSGGLQNPVETFSSDGPRRVFFNADGTPITPGNFSSTGGSVRQKPDLAAADGVMTLVFGRFFGTSAAAPHAAAIAALLKSYSPNLLPSQVRNALTGTALDIEAPGIDPNSGAGIVMADSALQSLSPRPVVIGGGSVLLVESCPNGVLDPGETVTLNFSLLNVGVANTTNLVATLLSSGGVTFPSGPQTYGVLVAKGGAANRAFSFIATGSCGGTNIATLQLQDGPNDLGRISFSFRSGNQRVPLAETFDGVTPPALPAGWTVFRSGAGTGWGTTNVASDSAPNSVFVRDPDAVSDNRLTSPIFPIITASAQLTFRHRFYTYNYGYDGGVLEISTNGGAFADIITAGGSFVTGGYYQTLYSGYGNPLQDRQAWTGSSGGFVTTTVNLPATAAGRNVQLRWRFGSGSGVGGGEGWYIDTLSLTDGLVCCATAPNNLVVRITDAPDPIVVGGNLNYTINIFNTGPAAAAGVSLTDVLPANFTFQSIAISQGVTPGPQANGGGTLNFNLGTLAGGGSATIVIGGTADSVGLLTNRVTVSRTDPDANTNDNSATAVTSVILPSLSINDVTLVEGNAGTTNAVFTANLWPPPGQTVTVHFATTNLSAVAGSDYVNTSGTLVFAPGVTNRTIAVPVIGETINEANETFMVNLSSPTNAVLAGSQGQGTILNDDPLPNLSVSDATVVVPSSGTTNAVFNVRLSARSGQIVTVNDYTSDGTAHGGSDYVPLDFTQLTFNPGETNKTIAVVVNAHVSVKPAQIFYLNLYSVSNAKLGHNPGLGTIITALPGQIDHVGWSPISSPQSNGVPFATTLTAQDFWNSTVSNFNGTVALSGASSGNQPSISGGSTLVIQTGSSIANSVRTALDNLGQPYDFVQTAALSGLDLSGYDTVILGMNGGGVEYADMAHLATAVNAGAKLIVLGGTGYLPFAQGLNDFFIHVNMANYNWTTVSGSPDLSVITPGHPLAANLPATYNFFNDSATYYMARVTDDSAETVAVNGDGFASLTTKPVGAGAVVLFINVASDDFWSNPGDFNVLSTVISNSLLWVQGGGATPVPITPTNSGNFVNGTWTGNITVQQPATNVTLRADDGLGHIGQSNPIDVLPTPGQTTHFAWSTIPSPQSNGVPFAVTITAQDYFNGTASNFTGAVAFTGSGVAGSSTNTILGAPTHTDSYSSANTVGYSFTPRTNMTVTHVRHYFGTRVSIWTDAGVLVTAQNVASTAGTWRETALTTPVQLSAGQRYRIGVYAGSGNIYYRYDLPGAFADGTIDQGYSINGNAFPINFDSPRWYFVDLRYRVDVVGSVPVAPAISGNFTAGVWSGSLAAQLPATNVTLRADDGLGHVGQSLPFNVAQTPGQITHFVWNTIPSPQSNGVPFAVTMTAKDYLNGTASNFTGTVALTGSGVLAFRTNNILGAPTHSDSSSGTYTFGYSFTPRTNLTVTHVRHYFGTRVSIWTEAGVLVAAQNVASTAGTWRETALTTPVQLSAGQRYRVGVYTTGNYYYRFDLPGTFPDGTIDQAYYVSGVNGFPTQPDGARWQFVDLRYQVDTVGSVPVSPTVSGNFTYGVWMGSVTMPQPGTNVTLRADDGLGHTGLSNPFNVAVQNDISLVMLDSPDPVFLGGSVTYTLTVSNVGPTAATGVVVTNLLPPAVAFVSATSSQGSCVPTGAAVICNLGTVPGGTNTTITIIVQPTAFGVITNVATVTRNEADVLLGNNTASAVTRVRSPFSAAVAIYGAENDGSNNNDIRNKLVAAGSSAVAGGFGTVDTFLVSPGYPVPTLTQLLQYDAVLVYSDYSFNDSVAFGDVLADYVDNGGGVVLATFAFNAGGGNGISGRISTGGYLPFTLGSAYAPGNLTLIKDAPAHPILNEVSSFNGGNASYHNAPINTTPGTELVAHWSNNQPLVGAKQLAPGRIVGLNFYPPSSDVSSYFWQSGTDGGLLMANALLWAAQHTNDISLSVTAAPDPADIRSNLTYTITVNNSGPAPATGVTLSNRLPASLYFVSLTSSQGTASNIGQAVVCNLGTLAAGASANVTLVTRPNADGLITNAITVTRGEAESHLANNTASVVTRVYAPVAGGSFQITGMFGTGAAAIEVSTFTGDDRGGLALSPTTAFLTGDNSTARFNAGNLSGGTALGQIFDSLVADLRTEQVYSLGNGIIPISSSGGTVTTLLELNGGTGGLNGNSITLSTAISLPPNGGNVGIFSGYGQVVLHTGNHVYSVAVPAGQVTDLGAMAPPSHQFSESWAYWGVAENFTGNTYLVSVQNSTTISRTRVPDGLTTTLASFSNLSDMASITVSIPRNRWYFHHEGTSQFRSGDETLGYAEATFSVIPGGGVLGDDLGLSASGSPDPAPAGANVTYTLTLTNTGPSLATGVVVSNVPPVGANLISFSSAQATASNVGGVLVFDFGSLPAGTNATATVVVHAQAGGILTNVATVTRSESDVYTPNNRAVVLTTVLSVPAISIADASVAEGLVGTTNLVFAVTLTAPSTQTITVNYATTNGTASAGSDYIGTNGVLTFPPGTTNRTIAVAVLSDILVETNETLFVGLSSPTNVVLGRSQSVGTIVNAAGQPGQLNHFAWSPIPSPQFNGAPFAVTITAQDYFNSPATNFTGTVALSGVAGIKTNNNILGSPTHAGASSGAYTFGYSFMPRSNITVTHVRHYFGNSVSIWTDAGVLVATQNVISPAGLWSETALTTPVQLSAGQPYRVGVYTGGGNYYWRLDLPGTFADGTIDQSYEASGNAFPASVDSARWWFVDLRYRVDTLDSVPINPTVSGNFANGVWSGSLTVQQPATNVTLRADDGLGHVSQSLPFDVASGPVPPVTVTLLRTSGNQMQLTWSHGILQSASQAAGPYTDVLGATSPYPVTFSAPQQFFRVRVN